MSNDKNYVIEMDDMNLEDQKSLNDEHNYHNMDLK